MEGARPEPEPPVTRSPNVVFELFLLVVLATLWGASYTFIKVAGETLPPVTTIAVRTLLAAVLLLGIVAATGRRLPRDPATWGRFLVQALLNSAVPFTLIAWAETRIDASLAVILNSTTPFFAFFLTRIFGGEPAGALRLFGVAVGLAGIVLTIGGAAIGGVGGDLPAQGAVLVASACYGGAALWGRSFKGLDPMLPAAGSLVCGAGLLLPVALVVDAPWRLAPSAASLAAVTALAVLSTALAFTLYFRLVHTLGSIGVTAQAYLRVPIGVAIGVAFLGERPAATALVGLGLVVVGVWAMTRPATR
jgi:drug/metabolite transporter (DMT)-like permease